MANRERMGGYPQDRRWMARVLDRTYDRSNRLADWGYPYPLDNNGKSRRNSLQGRDIGRQSRKPAGRGWFWRYALQFVARTDRKDDPRLLRFVSIYRSQQVKDYINQKYGRFFVPLW